MPHPNHWHQRATAIVEQRGSQQLLRQRQCVEAVDGRTVTIDGEQYLQFGSNDYLGLAFANEAIAAKGAGAAPLVSGYHRAHQQLEQQLCRATGYEAALLFSSGFAANSAPLALMQAGDRVLADKLAHASIIDAAQASAASLRRFPHNNLEILARWLADSDAPTIVATESVFSMDGDQAPVAKLVALAKQHGALSWIDDAHGFGVIGRDGLGVAQLAKPDLITVTFGKAMGASGAALLGSKILIDAITQHCKHYIYSTAMPVDLAQRLTQRLAGLCCSAPRQQLQRLIEQFRTGALAQGWPLGDSMTPIQPLLCNDTAQALSLAQRLQSHGIWVPAIRPPTVPQARLRIVINACHSSTDIDTLLQALGANR
ncbi:aminotransferase class I/II-fold pyridoxal phosphate-dependent enzyme [Ferrimonas lipolytica]|uniref:8-amino-7-oxononanoate synthase n=1 Tax=Ferrimonas lipolytica TaxID=2724191 RepID=A0A6H1UBS3_9GAMM|nr:8-amino-7-oxononanoate synthase [Ferrimonas lipolytica]QIZ76030.1 8-amino-7-oxononanoate synthase [Ferrimonas lipolytica]